MLQSPLFLYAPNSLKCDDGVCVIIIITDKYSLIMDPLLLASYKLL